MSFNLATILRESATAYPDKPARCSTAAGSATPSSTRCPTGSRPACARPASAAATRSGCSCPNLPQFVIAYFGILKAGCVVVPMNVLLKAPEVAFGLGDARARALITWAGLAEEAAKGAAEAGRRAVFVVNTPGAPEAPAGRRSRSCSPSSRTGAPLEPDRPRRHRGDRLHLRHHGPPEGRRAHPLPAAS